MNIVITGTSSGFGQLTTNTLAAAGHTVFATMRDPGGKNAKAAQAYAGTHGGRIHVVDMDVTSEASVDKAIATIAAQTGGAIDAVVNNAGRFSMGVQESFSMADVQALFDTNVYGPLRVNRAVLPHMRKRRAGVIINVSSILGRFSLATMGTYSASKYALEAFADALRDEVRALGIDVVLVEPGAFPTEVGNNGLYVADPTRDSDYGPVAQIPQKMGEAMGQMFSGPNAPKPQSVADAIHRVLHTAQGQRPNRVVIDDMTGAPVKALNDFYDPKRLELMTMFGLA